MGNIRRTAEIAFGESDDAEFIKLKNYQLYPERESFGWISNNSIFAKLGMDYSNICENIRYNGEPGLCWLENMRKYGRLCEPPNYRDRLAAGGNPCLEQTLESYEMCCLVETFPYNHSSYEEFEDTLKYAYMYCKTVTLGLSQWDETNAIIQRNRRIGCSMSGLAQFISHYGSLEELKKWCERGYKYLRKIDYEFSDFLGIPQSIKITSIKPSGTVSLLSGATPGIHFPESRYYIRRVRFQSSTELHKALQNSKYRIERDEYSKDSQGLVVDIPVCAGPRVRTLKEVPLQEQLEIAAFMQANWSDNQVSCTVQFDNETEGASLPSLLNHYQNKLKGISFFPKPKNLHEIYKQLPYEEITESQYNEMKSEIKPLTFTSEGSDPDPEKFCDTDHCLT